MKPAAENKSITDRMWWEASTVGGMIATIRMESGMRQVDLAHAIGVSERTLRSWVQNATMPSGDETYSLMRWCRREMPEWFDAKKEEALLEKIQQAHASETISYASASQAPTFGDHLLELRESAGLGYKELAGIVGVRVPAVSKWEVGKALPDSVQLDALVECFKERIPERMDASQEELLRSAYTERKYKTANEHWANARTPGPMVPAIRMALQMRPLEFAKEIEGAPRTDHGDGRHDTFPDEQLERIIAQAKERVPDWLTEKKIAKLWKKQGRAYPQDEPSVPVALPEAHEVVTDAVIPKEPVVHAIHTPMAKVVPPATQRHLDALLMVDPGALAAHMASFVEASLALLKQQKESRTGMEYTDSALAQDLNAMGRRVSGKWISIKPDELTGSLRDATAQPIVYEALQKLLTTALVSNPAWYEIQESSGIGDLGEAARMLLQLQAKPDSRVGSAEAQGAVKAPVKGRAHV